MTKIINNSDNVGKWRKKGNEQKQHEKWGKMQQKR